MGTKQILVDAKETQDHIVMTMKKPSLRYLTELVNMKCGPDLLALGLFPNAKEVSESFAAFHAVRKHLRVMGLEGPQAFGREDITVIAVGDGSTPRTAATFAFRSRWTCYSVDPRLREKWWGWKPKGIDRLWGVAQRIEDCHPVFDGPTIIVAVHSHATLEATLGAIEAPLRHIVAIPCCVPQELCIAPEIEYADWGIWSPERTVKIWLNV